ncbi:MAG: hypothetical protein HYU64_14260 [Armatimonadetes bacterium]|nr:hypothetical protein [Armatimonadota bacterium]
MTLSGLKDALDQAREDTGVKPDVLGFNLCEMAQIEVADSLKDAADIMIASENIQYTPGWPLREVLDLFVKGEKTPTPGEAAKAIVDACAKVSTRYTTTTSAVDLSKIETSKEAVRDLSEALLAVRDEVTIQGVRESFSQVAFFPNTPFKAPYPKDLGDLARKIISHPGTNDAPVAESAFRVVESLNKALIAEQHLPKGQENRYGTAMRQDATGLTINLAGEENDESYKTLPFVTETKWDKVIDKFGAWDDATGIS